MPESNPIFDSVFRLTDIDRYRTGMETSVTRELGRRKSTEQFYLDWRTFQISDHMPVWVQFAL